MKARTTGGAILAAATAALLVLSTPALAAGPGGGGGGGAGGGGETTTGSVYSDLVIALRAENGTPILQKYEVPETELTTASTEYCVQPVSYEEVPGVKSEEPEGWSVNPVDGRHVWVIPLQGEWIVGDTVPLDFTGACDPQPQYAMFVSEVELERLNLARTADEVIARKLADVALKLGFADAIALEATGRISYDGSVIDASPENAAIYQSLMKSGTIPGLPTEMAGPPAEIGPDGASNSQFDAWELAAMTIGAAASKSTPFTIDTVEYYNRIIGFPAEGYTPPAGWPISFNRSIDPSTNEPMTTGEWFVDHSGFSYNRSETFKGSVTWLDVPTLTWKVSKITDVVPFTNLSSYADDEVGTTTLTGVTAFAQLADDVRSMCNFIPDNTFLPGFYMDLPGFDTTEEQVEATKNPAVDLGTLPANAFQTYTFPITASLLNPWGGTLIDTAQLRVTIDAPGALTALDVIAIAGGQGIPFAANASGDLVGTWGPAEGFPVAPGYNVSTTFDVTVADAAPVGNYDVTLELVDIDDPPTVLASDKGTITVNDNVVTVMWGDSVPKLATQGVYMTIPLRVYSPADDTTGVLDLTITGPEALVAGDVKIYASNGTDMVALPLSPDADSLVGTWTADLSAGFNSVVWYATVAEGAPVGNYEFDVSLVGGNTLESIVVSVSAPESHGEKPPDAGDTTAPDVTIVPVDTALSTTVAFELTANESGSTFKCTLTKNGVTVSSGSCTSPAAYADLEPGTYIFSATATDLAGNESAVEDLIVVIRAAAAPAQAPPAAGAPGAGAPGAGAPGAGAPGAGAPSVTTPVARAAVVKVKAIDNGTKLFVNVNPNKGTGYWNIKVYRKVVKGAQVSWEKVGKTLRTKTNKETRTVNLGKGTYRVKVMEKYGMKGDVSNQVTLVR
jgi:hypothetical protein